VSNQDKINNIIRENQITMTADRVNKNPNNPDWRDADHWKVVFACGRRRMTTYFSMGRYGHNGAEPQASSVLSCLADDAASVQQSEFEEWAGDMGYEQDSRKAEEIYRACERCGVRLKKFLGSSLYDVLLYGVER
jgi:hypothetical protein